MRVIRSESPPCSQLQRNLSRSRAFLRMSLVSCMQDTKKDAHYRRKRLRSVSLPKTRGGSSTSSSDDFGDGDSHWQRVGLRPQWKSGHCHSLPVAANRSPSGTGQADGSAPTCSTVRRACAAVHSRWQRLGMDARSRSSGADNIGLDHACPPPSRACKPKRMQIGDHPHPR